jgi:hypothetical protein
LTDGYPVGDLPGAVFRFTAPWGELHAIARGFRRFLPDKCAYSAENPGKTDGKEGSAASFSFREMSDVKALARPVKSFHFYWIFKVLA